MYLCTLGGIFFRLNGRIQNHTTYGIAYAVCEELLAVENGL
jgi:hypothetical protein